MSFTRCIFIGKSGVGKTTLLRGAAHENVDAPPPTMGVDLVTCATDRGKLLCWDTSGQVKFRTIVGMFFKDCRVVVYVYDVSDPDSLDCIEEWYDHTPYKNDRLLILVGNRKGPSRVSRENILRLCERGNMVHLTCNSFCQDSVDSLFMHILYHARPFVQSLQIDSSDQERVCLHCAIL